MEPEGPLVVVAGNRSQMHEGAEILLRPFAVTDSAEPGVDPVAAADVDLHVRSPPLGHGLGVEAAGVLGAESVSEAGLPPSTRLATKRRHGPKR